MRVPARPLLHLTAAMLAFGSCHSVAGAADGTSPWKRGISTWNGSGYTLPPPEAATKSLHSPNAASQPFPQATTAGGPVPGVGTSGASSPASRYTTPIDPTAPANTADSIGTSGGDLSWLEATTASDRMPAGDLLGASSPVARIADHSQTEAWPESLPMLEGPRNDSSSAPSMTEQLEVALDDAGDLPLEEEVTRWYQYPWNWIRTGWKNHAEFGLDGSDGNANTLALTTGLELKRKSDQHTFAVDLDYRHATNDSETTQNNGRFNTDYDRLIGASRWSAFTKFGMEWDRFKAFDLRLNTNAGLGYHWIRSDDASLVTRFGAGTSKEFGSPDDDWVPEAVFGIDAERQLSKRHKIKGKIDYFPAWTNFNDYRVVADAAWEILLDDSDNLSLKLAVTDRYDSTPQGALPNDFYYSLLLLYKF